MVGVSTDVFTKRVLGEKHISGVKCENPKGGAMPPAPLCDAHDCKSYTIFSSMNFEPLSINFK